MKKLILIDGGPASGKNTLGELLIKMFNNSGDKIVLLDLDTFVEHFNPAWIWENDAQKSKDQLNARLNIAKEIDKYLQQDYVVIVIGERFLKKDDVVNFVSRLKTTCPVYLYHLGIPFALREKRLNQRGSHSLIDLAKDQKERDEIKNWPGLVYENVNSPEVDAKNLMQLIREEKGYIDVRTTKIIIDTDIGSEMTDAAALTLATISPEIELLGVTTVTHDSTFRASVAKKFLNLLGKKNIPVAVGFGTSGNHEWEKVVVFPEGYLPSKELDSRPAWKLILDLVNQKENVTLVGIGTTTNLAKALEQDSKLPQKVERLILMGGMINPPIVEGKTIPRGFEYNFCNDSASAEKIIKAGFNLTLVPGDLTFKQDDPWTDDELLKLANIQNPAIQLLAKLKDKSLEAMTEGMKKANLPLEFAKPWVNDELVITYVLKPELFKTEDVLIKWELPDKYPRFIISDEGYPLKLISQTKFSEARSFILERFLNL